ncbi:MAG: hypothetical protein ACI83B_000277 [Sediminicola sp.]|jgi:hypothetical protein
MKRFLKQPYQLLEWFLILCTPLLPLFFTLPYRINLFLAWEGAYRMSLGQIPYKDFGSPIGYVFWILPALFFKIFGPYVLTLIKTQVFINVVSNTLFAQLLKKFGIELKGRILAISVFVLSYTLFNFWPWYNHLVFVIELAAIYTAVSYVYGTKKSFLNPILAAILVVLAFLTKQDTGGLSFVLMVCIYAYASFLEKSFRPVGWFLLGMLSAIGVLIMPFTMYDFGYWFNLGQSPHFSRLAFTDLLDEFLGASKWLKFYLLIVVGIILYQVKDIRQFIVEPRKVVPLFIVLFILAQAAVIQITSYTPLDGNVYFHSFFVALLLFIFQKEFLVEKPFNFWVILFLIGFWWSNVYWVRFARGKVLPMLAKPKQEEVISKNTYLLDTASSQKMNRGNWVVPKSLETFKGIKIPQETIDGVKKLKEMPILNKQDIRVLNMTELTPLAYEFDLPYEAGEKVPLWYHKGVAFFDREVEIYCQKIEAGHYDLILFQDIPDVNNFYPYEVQECIVDNYVYQFKFLAPRIPEISYIYVYSLKRK